MTISIDQAGATYEEWSLTNTLSTTQLNGSSVSTAPPLAPCGTPKLWILEHNAAFNDINDYSKNSTTQLHISMLGAPVNFSNPNFHGGQDSDHKLFWAPPPNLYSGYVTDQEWVLKARAAGTPFNGAYRGPAYYPNKAFLEIDNKREINYYTPGLSLPVGCTRGANLRTMWKSFDFHRLTLPRNLFISGYGEVSEQPYCPSFWDNQILSNYTSVPYVADPTTSTKAIWETTASATVQSAGLSKSIQHGAIRMMKYVSGSTSFTPLHTTEGYFPPKDSSLITVECTSSGAVDAVSSYGFEFGSAVSIASSSHESDLAANDGIAFTGLSTCAYFTNAGQPTQRIDRANVATLIYNLSTPISSSGEITQAVRDSLILDPDSKKIETSLSYYSGSTSPNISLRTAYDALDHFVADSNDQPRRRTDAGADIAASPASVRHYNQRLSSSLISGQLLKLIK